MLGLPQAGSGDPLLMVLLVALGAAAANFPVMVSPRYKTDASPAIDLALVILFPPATAVALVGLSRILGDGILCLRRNPLTRSRRREPVDLVFQRLPADDRSSSRGHRFPRTGTILWAAHRGGTGSRRHVCRERFAGGRGSGWF